MSYAPSTKSFPEIFKSIPKVLTHPTGIAVMASVAIHVVLGISLPYLSKTSSQEKSQPKRNVQLVKLTPAELDRVAQQAPSAPLSLPTQIQQLAPLPGAPSTPFPPLNFNSSSSGNSALFNLPSTIADPPTNKLALSSPSPSPNALASPSPNAKASPSPKALASPSPNVKASPSPNASQIAKSNQTNPDIPVVRVDNLPTRRSILSRLDQGNIPSSVAPSTPLPPPPQGFITPSSVVRNDFSAPQTIQPEFSTPRSPVAANPGSTPPAPPSAPVITTPPGNSVPLSSLPSREQAAQQLRQQLPQQGDNLRPNSANTSNEEARNNYIAYMSKANQLQAGERSIAGAYPQEACVKQLEGAAVVMLTVGADGKASSPQLIKSSGYGIFDDKAIAAAQSSSFENSTGQPQPYRVSVDFKYDKAVCPSLSIPQNSEKPQEAAKPQNTPEAKKPSEVLNTPEIKKPSEALSTPEPKKSSEALNIPESKKSPEPAITTDPKKLPEPPNVPAQKK